MRSLRAMILLVSLAVAALPGCGGGGGGGGASSISAEPIATSDTMRQLQPGDMLTYSVTGSTRAPVAGTATVTTQTASVQPYPTMRLMEVTTQIDVTVAGQQAQSTVIDYLAQTPTGTLIKVGSIVDGVNRFGSDFSPDPIHCPSPVAVDATWAYKTTYGDSSTDNTSCWVSAMEAANGRMAYKVITTIQGPAGTTTRQDWVVPDLGYPAKMVWSQAIAGGMVDLTANLTNKSF